MNTTLRYWYPHEQRCRYISFSSITQAIEMIKEKAAKGPAKRRFKKKK